jgi:hypothetical protein
MEHRFQSDEWQALTPRQRGRRFQLMAKQAQDLANEAWLKFAIEPAV